MPKRLRDIVGKHADNNNCDSNLKITIRYKAQ